MRKKKQISVWLHSFPAMVLIGGIIVFPIIYTAYISLTNMNLFHWDNYEMIGLDNYVRALFKVDTGFLTAILTTLLWTALNMVFQVVIAFFMALGLNAPGLRLKNVYKTLLMFPWAMPAYVSILLWRVGIYNTEFGLANKVLSALGFEKINYLSQNVPAFISCMVLNLWMALPFMIMMFDGALQSIDKSYYENVRKQKGKLTPEEKQKAELYYQAQIDYPQLTVFQLLNPFSKYRDNLLEVEAYKENPGFYGFIRKLFGKP